MKAKKNRDLALKLIDDLLDDENESSSVDLSLEEDSNGDSQPPENSDMNTSEFYGSQVKEAELEDDDLSQVIEISSVNIGASEETVAPKAESNTPEDATIKLSETKLHDLSADRDSSLVIEDSTLFTASSTGKTKTTVVNNQSAGENVRTSVGKYVSASSGGMYGATEAALAQSENLRVAQQKILDLEKEIERLRLENEQLAAAGETLRKKSDEHLARLEKASTQNEVSREQFAEEKKLLTGFLEGKVKETDELKMKIEELEMRLSTNIQKIRVRERELENRLELVKMEGSALVRSKDELILDLKRQVDQLSLELENYRTKGQDLNKQLGDKQDMLRRTVKALRIALSMLEGESEFVKKKAE